MAKKRISKEDIAPEGIFFNVTDGAKKAKVQIDLLKKSIDMLKKTAKGIKKDIGGAKVGDTKGMKDFDALQKKSNQTAKAKLGIDKQLLHHKAKLSQLQRDENKAIKTTIEAQSKLSKKQEKNLGTLQKLELSSRKLRAERAKLNLETKKGSRRLKEINSKLDQNNAKIRASGDAMKKQKLNVGNYGGAVGKLTGMLAKLGLGFGVFTLLKGAFNVVKDFEQSQANLASVLGINVDAMKALTEQAQELGATTTFTASQVAELQLEFAKLGFTQTEIEGMTESTLLLAEATGSELGETASIVGATMRGFGLDVGETQRVVDVMANSFSKSSLDMSKFSTAMASVAPVANLAGVSLEGTTALLGTLTDRGIEASTAGTGLRNMFLQANKHGLTFNQSLDQIKNSTDQTGEAMKLFGTRGATLGVVLANNQEQVAELTAKLELSNGASKAMADTQRDTLGGAIKLLTSAWEGWILKMNESSGAGDQLKDTIKFLADNLETILDMVILATKSWLAYKAIVTITIVQNKILAMSFVKLGKAQGGIKGALKGMSAGLKNVGKALKANAIGIAIVAIVFAFTKLNAMYKKMNRASIKYAEIQDSIGEIHSKATEDIATEQAGLTLLVAEIKLHNAGSEERGRLLTEMNEKYGTHLQNIDDETEANRQLDVQQQKVIDNMVTQIRLQAKKDEFTVIVQELMKAEEIVEGALEERTKRIGAMTDKQINDWKKLALRGQSSSTDLSKYLNKMSMQELRNHFITQNLSIAQKKDIELVNKLKQDQLDLEAELMVSIKKKNATQEEVDAETPEEKKARLAKEKLAGGGTPTVKPFVDLERATQDAILKIIEDAQKRERDIRQTTFDRLVKDTEKKKTHTKDFDAWKKAQEDLLTSDLLKIEKKYDDKKEQNRQKSILTTMENGITEKEIELEKVADIFENFEETEKLRKDIEDSQIKLIEKKAEFDVKNAGNSTAEKEKIITDSELKIEQIKKAGLDRTLAHEKKAREILKGEYQTAENEKLLELLKTDMSQKEISDAMLKYQIEQLEEMIAEYKKLYPELTDEITKMEIDLEQKKRARDNKDLKGTEDAEKEMAELRQNAIQVMTDFYMKKADERIAKLDEEIEAHKKQADLFAQMAVEGNISAKESLAEENRLIAEAEKEKAEEEKRKQQMLMVSAVIKAYYANLDVAGTTSGEALTKAITSKVVLDQFVAGIGSFFDGTEDTGKVGNPLDSNGGRIAVLHDNERVLTAKQNKKIGGYSNEQVASIVEKNRLGNLAGNIQIGDSWESQLVVDQLMKVEGKLDEVNKTIQNKEVNSVELGAVTQTAMKLVETRKRGSNRTISTYKVKV